MEKSYPPQYSVPTPDDQSYMSFTDAVKVCFNKYCTFQGRASRAEFWWWQLFVFIICAAFSWATFFSETFVDIISGIVNLVLLLPSLGVAVRRMHDIGKGGGWIFINFIPLVGWIIYIVFACRASEPFPNRFGDVPA